MDTEDAATKPPICREEAYVHREAGAERADPYHWLCRRGDRAVREHLEAENRYKEEMLRPVEEFREDLFRELVGRMRQDRKE
mgnify:FL=1